MQRAISQLEIAHFYPWPTSFETFITAKFIDKCAQRFDRIMEEFNIILTFCLLSLVDLYLPFIA